MVTLVAASRASSEARGEERSMFAATDGDRGSVAVTPPKVGKCDIFTNYIQTRSVNQKSKVSFPDFFIFFFR